MNVRGRRLWYPILAVGIGGLLVVVSGIFATSRSAEDVADHAVVALRAERVVTSAGTAQSLMGQAVLVAEASSLGAATGDQAAAAVSAARTGLAFLAEDVARLDDTWDEGDDLVILFTALEEGAAKVLDHLEAGDVAAGIAAMSPIESPFGELTEVTAAERDRRSGEIALAREQAARVALATRWVVALFIPALGVVAVRLSYRRRTQRLLLEAELSHERTVRTAKERFLAAVVHHLRTPLTSVVGFAQILREGRHRFNAGQRNEMIETLADEAADLGELIEDLHVAARSDPDTIPVSTEVCDVRRVAETVAVGFRTGRGDLNISGRGTASADPLRLRQILRHLVDNALKHGRDRAAVSIRTEGRFVVVDVRDDGPGLPVGVSESVFRGHVAPADDTAESLAIGVGLGLSRRLAERMGGRLVYERRDGLTVLSLHLVRANPPIDHRPSPGKELVSTEDVVHAIHHSPPDIALQPIVDLQSLDREAPQVVGFEALSRFPKAAPPEWFDAAAGAGLEMDLELTAIRRAVDIAVRLPGEPFLALNVSTETLLSNLLLEAVESLPPERVVFELSEDAAVSNYEKAKHIVAALRDRGYRLALDDVGSGEMDLWHVLRLRPAIVKLDISLVSDLALTTETVALIEALVVFTSRMDARVIAEGIESEAQLDRLRRVGVHWGQGYRLGRPRTPDHPEFSEYENLARESARVPTH